MHRDNIAAVVDTANISLLKLTLDPFEQDELVEQAAAKKNIKSYSNCYNYTAKVCRYNGCNE